MKNWSSFGPSIIAQGGIHDLNELCASYVCFKNACGKCANCVAALKGVHKDVHIYNTDASEYPIKDVRDVVASAYNKPQIGRFNVSVILNAERLSEQGQDTLLKLLEEPDANAAVILWAKEIANLRDTVKSRCVILRMEDDESKAMDFAPEDLYEIVSNNSLYAIQKSVEQMLAKIEAGIDSSLPKPAQKRIRVDKISEIMEAHAAEVRKRLVDQPDAADFNQYYGVLMKLSVAKELLQNNAPENLVLANFFIR